MQNHLPPTKGIRHIALNVGDLTSMRHFYVDILGFHVEWEPDSDNLYLSSGSDNLALHRAQSPAAAASRLDHFGILVPKPENVDEWADYLKGKGVRLNQEPKTHRDGARSIYFADPEGNVIQLIYHPPISDK
jgi:catechol 2,3-dioxygenase-like lactoylglutathione lyase family enzyme